MACISFTMATSSLPLFSRKKSQQLFKQTHRFHVSCIVASDDNEKPLITTNPTQPQNLVLPKTSLELQNVDRRNLLLGLGGLYSTVNLTAGNPNSAFAVPITAPSDISTCKDSNSGISDTKNAIRTKACCPPKSKKTVKDFTFPRGDTVRTRPAAHRITPLYLKKYKTAIKAMRDLPDDHPHSFKQQAMIHCAYCNGGYTQIESGKAYKDKEIQIHNSWLFFPFHRWYLYFFEKIMGKLINDPTFAMPYWNWDNPTGMTVPAMFEAPVAINGGTPNARNNPLFDAYRDVTHLPPTLIDFQNVGGSDEDIINGNLAAMYNQMITTGSGTDAFFGGHMVAGPDGVTSAGSIERGVHTRAHVWVGNPRMANREDMGNFYSAGYDALFYCHHANVDRMWTIWKQLDEDNNDPTAFDDWNNASYVFYDENKNLVRVYNKDCVDTAKLGYDFAPSDTPWIDYSPTAHSAGSDIANQSIGKIPKVEETTFPVKLDKTVKVLVKRPAVNRTHEEKEKVREILYVNGIQFDGTKYFKFNVLVDDVEDGTPITPADSEFAGTFEQLQHGIGKAMKMTSGATFGITGLLEDLEADGDEYVLVALVPVEGCEDVTVSEIKIELLPIVGGNKSATKANKGRKKAPKAKGGRGKGRK